jgi:hypothetical protein
MKRISGGSGGGAGGGATAPLNFFWGAARELSIIFTFESIILEHERVLFVFVSSPHFFRSEIMNISNSHKSTYFITLKYKLFFKDIIRTRLSWTGKEVNLWWDSNYLCSKLNDYARTCSGNEKKREAR